MFETEAQQGEYGRYGGRRWRRRRRRYLPPDDDDQETGIYGGDGEYDEAEYSDGEAQGSRGQG